MKATIVAGVERFSISLNKERGDRMRALVEKGVFPNLSSAFDAAAEALLEREDEKAEWWEETLRRCEEAEKHPEKMLDPDTFFRELRAEIDELRQSRKA